MRIALVYPEVYDLARFKEGRKEFPPFGVLYLAAELEQAGHNVDVLAVRPEALAFDLDDYELVAYSVSASATYNLLVASRRESRFNSETAVAVGGVHCQFFPDQTLRDFDADVACPGAADETIRQLADAVPSREFARVPGMLYRAADVVRLTQPAVEPDISVLPFPARHLLPHQDVFMRDRLAGSDVLMTHVMFSRGCPFHCAFCAVADTKIQYRSGANARAELEHLKRS